jgi:predicted Ser/Thr protein kinase
VRRKIGKYELIKEIGKGGMGEVYLARDTESGKEFAVKILAPELTRNPQYVRRFRREASAVVRLDHPHIIKVYDVGEEGGIHFIAMEYLGGPTLVQLLKQRKRLSVPEAVKIVTDIADALDYAHSQGVVHRDVKPDNMIADENGEFKLMDFGIAHVEEGAQLTVTGSILGTPEYMSPEQASGQKVDPRTDIYALGIVFYQLLTGVVPFRAGTVAEVLQMHLARIPESPKALNPEVPGKLASVVTKMVEKKPADRYASFRHVINAVGQAIPLDMRTVAASQTRALRTEAPKETERPGPRVRERIILQTPARVRAALALSIAINLVLFGFVLFRPAGARDSGAPMRRSFGIRGPVFAPPAVSEGMLYIGSEDGTLYACDLQTGAVRWTFKAGDKIEAAPVADGSRVYVGSWDGYVYALDSAAGGAVVWKVNTGDIILAAPVLSNGILYVCTRNGDVFAIDAETGAALWSDPSARSARLSPTVLDGVLLVPSTAGKLLAYAAADGRRLGSFMTGSIKTSPVAVGQRLYLVVFDDAAGRDELWSPVFEYSPLPESVKLRGPETHAPLVAGL